MKAISRLCRAGACFAFWTAASLSVAAAEVYVSPTGRPGADGSVADPFGSLEAARDWIRTQRASNPDRAAEPIHVWVRGGIYIRTESFQLEARDSGTAGAPIVYAAYGQEKPRLAGGPEINKWEKVEDRDVLNRLHPDARDHVRQARLPAQGVTEFGQLQSRGFGGRGGAALELFLDGEPMTLARWPNAGWMTIQSLPDGEKGSLIGCESERLKRWTGAEDAWLFGYWFHGWADQFLPIASIDSDRKQIKVGEKHSYGFRQGQRFFALNLLEELDQPGEYFLSRKTGLLYFWPPKAIEKGDAIVSVLNAPLITTRDASHIKFEGLQLEATRSTAAVVSGGTGIIFERCAVAGTGAGGIDIREGSRHRVSNCTVAFTGETGISLAGGDRQTLEAAGHEAVGNRVHQFGRTRRTYQPGVRLSGVGNRAAQNLLYDSPHMAIGFGGNDHIIEHNEIHHVLLETDDAGAMYIGRDWTTRGHVIRFNFVHHSGNHYAPVVPPSERTDPTVVYEPLRQHGVNLLYFDDAASGITVEGNILHDGGRAVMIGGGRDHVVRNNLILGGQIGIWIDSRGTGWAAQHIKPGGGWNMYDKLKAARHDQPPYSTKYPGLAGILDNEPHLPLGNRVEGNIIVGAKEWLHLQGAPKERISFVDNQVIEETALPLDNPAEALRQMPKEWIDKIGFNPASLDRKGEQKN